MRGETELNYDVCGSSLTPSNCCSTCSSNTSLSSAQRRTRRCSTFKTSSNKSTLPPGPKVVVASLCLASFYCQQSSAFSHLPPSYHYSKSRSYHRHNSEAVDDNPFNAGGNDILSSSSLYTFSSTQLSVRKKKPMPIVGYNGQEICDYYDRSPLVVGWRLNILSLPLLGQCLYSKNYRKLHSPLDVMITIINAIILSPSFGICIENNIQTPRNIY